LEQLTEGFQEMESNFSKWF